MRTTFARAALACALAAAALAGCDRASMQKADQEGAEIGKKAEEVLARTKEELEDAGRKARAADTGKQAREALADAAITASIKTDFLKDPDLSVFKIDVDTKDGVVTLNGLAENDDARTRAQRIAGNVKGVREVRNLLVTKKA